MSINFGGVFLIRFETENECRVSMDLKHVSSQASLWKIGNGQLKADRKLHVSVGDGWGLSPHFTSFTPSHRVSSTLAGGVAACQSQKKVVVPRMRLFNFQFQHLDASHTVLSTTYAIYSPYCRITIVPCPSIDLGAIHCAHGLVDRNSLLLRRSGG